MIGIATKVAAGASLVALGSLGGYTVGSGPNEEQTSAAAAKRRPVEVRTQTIHRTVRVVKHERPHRKQPESAAPATPAVTAAPAVPVSRSTPVAPQAAPPQPTSSTPVRTRTSGAGSSGDEREHGEEHEGGDHEGGDD
jgi:hypothetical protein